MTTTETRAVLSGTPASAGAAVGPVVRVPEPLGEPPAGPVVPEDRREVEAARVAPAGAAVSNRMMATAGTPGLGKEVADVLYATAMMAEDPSLLEAAANAVRDHGTPAPRAVYDAAARFVAALQAAGGYMAERAGDVADVRDRIVAELLGVLAPGVPALDGPSVLVARDLAPADTATLDPAKALALVTVEGGPTSHTAILARSLGIPAVVGCPGAETLVEGTLVRVDGTAGEVVEAAPGTTVGADLAAAGPTAVEGPVTTTDGRRIAIVANIADAKDATKAAGVGAEGVGLLRTELTFLSAATEPTEIDQRAGYAATMAPLAGRPVTARTLDAGADKPVPFLTMAPEANPALGVRGQRVFDEGAGDAAERSSTIGSGDAAERSSTIGSGDAAERSSTIGSGDAAERSSTIGSGDAAERSSTIGSGDAAERSSTIGSGDAAERSSTIRSAAADRVSVLDRQLAALVGGAADAGVTLKVMAPMISTADEARRFVTRARAAGAEQVGVMIEVPAAVLNAPELLDEVDFVSVGTNDLTQYVFAADRQSGALAGFNDPWQPAVLRLLDQLCRAASVSGTPVGVCGEAAADPALAVVLVGLGVTSLSAAAAALPAVAASVASVDVATAQRAARAALAARDVAAARAAVRDVLG